MICRWVSLLALVSMAVGVAGQAGGQAPSTALSATAEAEARQISALLGMDAALQTLRDMQARRVCGAAPDLVELGARQEVLELVTTAQLDVDAALSEIAAERSDLFDQRATLQARRDRTVGYLNAASLITGSGVGVVVNATQLRNSSAIPGDYVGVGSGVVSTILSIVATRKMQGGRQSVGSIPNMLAPLFDERPALQTHYPVAVMRFLESVPAGEDPSRGTRLEQMRERWVRQGRIGSSGSAKDRAKVDALTSSQDSEIRLSIGDMADRIAMLDDVSSQVTLIKRDVSVVMYMVRAGAGRCRP